MSVTDEVAVLVPAELGAVESLTTLATPQLSLVADGAPRATLLALHLPASAVTVTSLGQVIDGFSDWESVVLGERVDLGGCRFIKKKKRVLVPAGYGSLASFTSLATPQV